jgi:hypothetical protein
MNNQQNQKKHEVSIKAREHEINLFWQRSLFYWGFISVSLITYTTLSFKRPIIALFISCFGLICSISWSMINRGSKYWQEYWEKQVEDSEVEITGPLFSVDGNVQQKGLWLSARKFSPSKITIALSDYTSTLWLFLLAIQIITQFSNLTITTMKQKLAGLVFVLFTLVFASAMWFKCKTSIRHSKPKDGTAKNQ